MKQCRILKILGFYLFLTSLQLPAQQQARVEMFSPQGTVKGVRQVRARFSEPMVAFGDPRAVLMPFDIDCPVKGTGRWIDARNWVYDFESDLAAGIRCEFRVRDGVRSLVGNDVAGQKRFTFSTGGPSILSSNPYQGSAMVDEDQIFILQLDSDATSSSVLKNVSFTVEGLSERVSIRIVSGKERDEILKAEYPDPDSRPRHLLLIQSKQRFPVDTKIKLIWGKGVSSPSGILTEQDQLLPFATRAAFAATFHCLRENPQAQCVPISPMRLGFSAPITRATARKIVLKEPGGKQWTPKLPDTDQDEDNWVYGVTFPGPFPEKSPFTIELPSGIRDDSGRALSNADKFPLTVQTDEYPPLAKFAADFGILELKSNPMLPVTLRNVEPSVSARVFEVEGGEGAIDPLVESAGKERVAGSMQGKIYRVPQDKPRQMLYWIKTVEGRTWEDRDQSIFGPVTAAKAKPFTIPKLHGAKAFEVVGIPLKSPGFYVVEIESEILGAALLGESKPMYVPTTALVTNLSVHFKRGSESSLVWVTSLDKAQPAARAAVQICDCAGKILWEGRTDRNGIARVGSLPAQSAVAQCADYRFDGGLLVTARLADDMTFVHTSMDEGIEPWRFRLPTEYEQKLLVAHTILDRSLLRAGETVHMKHILRKHGTGGFTVIPTSDSPKAILIQHLGTDHKYEFPLKWDAGGIAETTWTIPKDCKLGEYEIYLAKFGKDDESQEHSGSFRVEEYRVPLMKGVIRPPSSPLVAPSTVAVDLTVSYLAAGGAASLPVKFRYDVVPTFAAAPEDFDGFTFSNGKVREGASRREPEEEERPVFELRSTALTLDKAGSVRTTITDLPKADKPLDLIAELEFRDPNGEVQTVSARLPLWPAERQVGIKTESWTVSRESVKFQVAVIDLAGKPVADAPVRVDVFQRRFYSHRKRLVGGFYAYEHSTETQKIQTLCEGRTDKRGLLLCEKPSPTSGQLILQAVTQDGVGREIAAHQNIWVAGKGEWWFRAEDGDRIDVIPEAKRYEPGDKAKFQVRMPFRRATALVTVEREGIAEAFVKELSGKEPVIELPVKGNYAPNIFVSVLAVRGRVSGVQPTATVDLGRPAYKLGITEINVGWKAHELKVRIASDRAVYKIREKAKVSIDVATADGKSPPRESEVAVAAVDEGLLELMPNASWRLLEAMMGRRQYGVQTATAQIYVIGKRHFGLKALPQGGGGGRQITRELFDTLLLWKGRLPLDAAGHAWVEVPLNDSLTSFRIVAIAMAGNDLFGTGSTSIRSTQDLMILSGIPPVVRQGDRYRSEFTVRNASERALEVQVSARVKELGEPLAPIKASLAPGESTIIGWNLTAPVGVDSLRYELEANAGADLSDRLGVVQRVVPAIPVRTFQATLTQVDREFRMEVERPKDAIAGRGGIQVSLRPTLVEGMNGVKDYLSKYAYTCLEQGVSKAVGLRDSELWKRITSRLPAYLDSEGLAKYFPSMRHGSDVLTAYLLAIAHEAGWQIADELQQRMVAGLRGFVEGKVIRHSSLPTADLAIRKLAAVEALFRYGRIEPGLLSSITIEPNLWPTSAVIDWFNILKRVPNLRNRDSRMQEAEQILRSRLNFQGTTMGFSTEGADRLWWLMISGDSNALRLILSQLDSAGWREDLPRVVRGVLARQRQGHWDTTLANAWGVLAVEKFSKAFEKTPVTGTTTARLAGKSQAVDWSASPKGQTLSFPWPTQPGALAINLSGTGMPWATVQSLVAIPLKEPFSSGFKIKKTLTPIEQKEQGSWSRGDIIRVRLELEAQADMTWVVVSDPIPAGTAILGTGLGIDSMLATKGEKQEGWVWPAFEERSFEAFRAYYEYVPKGSWTIEYTMRLNNEGVLNLPATRVEALYAPEMFGEIPNEAIRVKSGDRDLRP